MALFETKYGFFTDDGNEYIIKTPKTPKPWINIISNGNYGLVISQSGGGFSWLEHSEFNRLNRWHQDLVQDNWGKYFYIKNNITGELWSPTWMPLKVDLDYYQCKHGFGYTQFISEFKGIKITLTIFIPLNEELEIWNFDIENNLPEDISLTIYSYFEWCLGSSSDFHREFHKTFLETDFDNQNNLMSATKRLWEIPLGDRGHWNIEYPYLGFISSNKKIYDYDGDKETFIGQYGSINYPDGVRKSSLAKRIGKWNDSIAAIAVKFDIKSLQNDSTAFYIGIKKNKNEILKSINKYLTRISIKIALEEVTNYWANTFSTLQINTPDQAMNLLVNKWLRYQAIAGRLWARTAYYQQSGAYGFRDQLQDSLVYLAIDPEFTKNQIRLHARHQFQDGTVLHWWHPITETGLQTKMTDDLLWLPFLIINYIKETNDYKILDIKENFYDNKKSVATLYNHSILAIDRVLSRFSKRGLPLIGAGDWNDGLSAVGLEMKGESIWLAEFLYLVLIQFAKISESINRYDISKRYQQKAKELKKSFNEYSWDGNWFFRATKDDGNKIGSKLNSEGKIYLNTQTWAVISEIADNNKQITAMKSVSKYLLKNNGCLLLWPAYKKPDKMIGYLSRYAPGRRENGGVYTHSATWAIWAFAYLKENKSAFKSYKNLCPIYNGLEPDKYSAEPYVTPGNIDGPDSPNYGMAGWTWYTGSANWFQKVVVEWILGIRVEFGYLIIDPCIPPDWKFFSVKRIIKGTEFIINVHNNSKTSKSVFQYMVINNKKYKSNKIEIANKNNSVIIDVFLDNKYKQIK